VQQQYVGIDLHRRRSVIVRLDDDGEKLSTVKINNDPIALSLALAEAGPDPEVAVEACYGWYWAVDLLQAEGATVHLVHPSGLHWGARRVKNDERDATEIAQRLRRHDLPEAWIAPPLTRELRELVRYRAKLVALRSGLKAQVHAVLAKEGVRVGVSSLKERGRVKRVLVAWLLSVRAGTRRTAGGVKVERPQRQRGRTTLGPPAGTAQQFWKGKKRDSSRWDGVGVGPAPGSASWAWATPGSGCRSSLRRAGAAWS
jgi:transposase